MRKAQIKMLYTLADKLNRELYRVKSKDISLNVSRLRTRLYDLTTELGSFEKAYLEKITIGASNEPR